jgi:hypothetical protein
LKNFPVRRLAQWSVKVRAENGPKPVFSTVIWRYAF